MSLVFRTLHEDSPGDAWRSVVARGWPGWRDWYLSAQEGIAPDLASSQRALRRYMPEMERVVDRLVATAGGDEHLARFLTFWMPPRYLAHCSQIALIDDEGPALVRNYDLNPSLAETTMLHSQWLAKPVVGMVDGLSGLADGMNGAGLAVSLAFGGRFQTGRGFGIPLIVRYILETCRDTQDAIEVLRHVPSHMSYNLTLIDKSGASATAYVGPDRPMMLARHPLATNHQIGVEWTSHATQSKTIERESRLISLCDVPSLKASDAVAAMQSAPLFAHNPAKNFYTVYTAVYRPLTGDVELSWPNGQNVKSSVGTPQPQQISVDLSKSDNIAIIPHQPQTHHFGAAL